ncbi:MAG: hypothetical protein HC768_07850 [Acaryochloris sp. CRU_2_0]|nr:hypothetical protein [Acaryochloris sp. CRU_2_0]
MTQKPNLNQMTRQALRAYVLSHRDDQEALHLYMDRLRTEPGVNRHTGAFDPEGAAHLESLIQQQANP